MDKRIRMGAGGEIVLMSLGGTRDFVMPDCLLQALGNIFKCGTSPYRKVEFGGGSFSNPNLYEHIPEDERVRLAKITDNLSKRPPFFRDSRKRLESNLAEAMKDTLSEETTLDLRKFNIHPTNGSTRSAIGHILNNFESSGKAIALPIPNWYFWDNKHGIEGDHNFKYFEALNEDQLVSGFSKLAKGGKLDSVIISNPMTPLGYEISRDAAKEIDKVALHHGIKVLVDDVLRGTREVGERDTLASVFTNPYVAEGLGHRLGYDNRLGKISLVLTPVNDRKINIPDFTNPQDIDLLEPLFRLAMKHASTPTLTELRKRNSEFDIGFRETAPDGVNVHRPYPTSITSLVTIPNSSSIDAINLASMMYLSRDILTGPISAFYPKNYDIPKAQRYNLRVSVGGNHSSETRENARILGEAMTDFIR
ncbi:MAG: hypothetical protein AABW82_00400 [Nanoarchaeota archaeon]